MLNIEINGGSADYNIWNHVLLHNPKVTQNLADYLCSTHDKLSSGSLADHLITYCKSAQSKAESDLGKSILRLHAEVQEINKNDFNSLNDIIESITSQKEKWNTQLHENLDLVQNLADKLCETHDSLPTGSATDHLITYCQEAMVSGDTIGLLNQLQEIKKSIENKPVDENPLPESDLESDIEIIHTTSPVSSFESFDFSDFKIIKTEDFCPSNVANIIPEIQSEETESDTQVQDTSISFKHDLSTYNMDSIVFDFEGIMPGNLSGTPPQKPIPVALLPQVKNEGLTKQKKVPIAATHQSPLPTQEEAWKRLKNCKQGSPLYKHWDALLSSPYNGIIYTLIYTSLADEDMQPDLRPVEILQLYLRTPNNEHINNMINETLTSYLINESAIDICADGHCMFGSLLHEILKNKNALKESNIWDKIKDYLPPHIIEMSAEDFKKLIYSERLDAAKLFRCQIYTSIIKQSDDDKSTSYQEWEAQLRKDRSALANNIQGELFGIVDDLEDSIKNLSSKKQEIENRTNDIFAILAIPNLERTLSNQYYNLLNKILEDVQRIELTIQNLKDQKLALEEKPSDSSMKNLNIYCEYMISNSYAGMLDQKLFSILTGLSIKMVQQQENQHQVYTVGNNHQSPYLKLYRTGERGAAHYRALNLDLTNYPDLSTVKLLDKQTFIQ